MCWSSPCRRSSAPSAWGLALIVLCSALTVHPKRRDVVVGMSNQRVVEVRSGLIEGEKVVLDPASLAAEDRDEKTDHCQSD